MSERVLIKNAKIIGRLEHYPRDYVVQNLDNTEELYRVPVEKVYNKVIGDIGNLIYKDTSDEGFYIFR